MPSLGSSTPLHITVWQFPPRNHLVTMSTCPNFIHFDTKRTAHSKEKITDSPWRTQYCIRKNLSFSMVHFQSQKFLVKAVANIGSDLVLVEDKVEDGKFGVSLVRNFSKLLLPNEGSTEEDERELRRRMRISKANKGNVPWNKGRKHSAETIERIRERTKEAMQDPKVKMKLMNLGHAQSEETKAKIAVGVRMGWERKRKRRLVQETCCLTWQNVIAEASRKGFTDEDELQWDSYNILRKQLSHKFMDSVEKRKLISRGKGGRRAPKSAEQRRKISEAIRAKWADPEYREHVSKGMFNFYGTPDGVERKPRKKTPRAVGTPTVKDPVKKTNMKLDWRSPDVGQAATSLPKKRPSVPSFKDPHVNSKLKMIKKIKAERIAQEAKKREATQRAKWLIAEAEKAAKALETAASTNLVALASLIEIKKLIGEATQSIETIEARERCTYDGNVNSTPGPGLSIEDSQEKFHDNVDALNINKKIALNGNLPSLTESDDFGLGSYMLPDLLTSMVPLGNVDNGESVKAANGFKYDVLNDICENKIQDIRKPESSKSPSEKSEASKSVTKKWICGRLVEVEDN